MNISQYSLKSKVNKQTILKTNFQRNTVNYHSCNKSLPLRMEDNKIILSQYTNNRKQINYSHSKKFYLRGVGQEGMKAYKIENVK